ncbi:MAG: sulfatase-like hydrolase/transferase [Verrucomicrobia bacterium]|nr:sulfatase-like hydrolase/transferase [Verrucomicrobiota bacterium]
MPRFFRLPCLALASVLLAPAPSFAAAPARPNLLVILADDLGYADLGVHGGRDVPTPHLDALARSGVRFTHGYVSAPYCGPSRAGFFTGRYQTRFGAEFNARVGDESRLGLPLAERTIGDHLRAAGYATGLIGKWHLGFSPDRHPLARGFDEYFGFLVAMHNFILRADREPEFEAAYSRNLIYRGREVQRLDGYTTDLFTDEAIAFLRRQTSRPWFLCVAHNAVHTPLEVLKKYGDRVPAAITDPERRGYLSLLIGLDNNVGRLLGHLRESGQERNTLVCFFSDNGGAGQKPYLSYNTGRNAPLRGNKGQVLEGGNRVPFFLSWPGTLPAGGTYDEPVISLDIAATALAAAGRPIPPEMDGVNLLPWLRSEKSGAPHAALYWRLGPQRAIRAGQWKLVDWRDFAAKRQSGWQLYDLSRDVGEQDDLAARHPEIVARLSRDWENWNRGNIAPLWQGSSTEDPTAPEYRPQKTKKKR